jgi:gamma-glutamyltranspeptidase/glutathione hydrolase
VDEDWALGRLTAAAQTQDPTGKTVLKAAANPRFMQGYAAGR